MADILDPSEASSGTKYFLTYVMLTLVTLGAIAAALHEGFRSIYMEFGELVLACGGFYFTGNIIHKVGAGVVNGKYAVTSAETDSSEDLPKPPVK